MTGISLSLRRASMMLQSFDSSPLAWSSFPGKHATTDLSGVGRGVRLLSCINVVLELKNLDSKILLGAAFAHL